MTATGTGGDEVVHLMLGEANLLEHGAIQVGMSLAVESDVGMIVGIVAAPSPLRRAIRWWNEMRIGAIATGSATETPLVVSIGHSVFHFTLDRFTTALRPLYFGLGHFPMH